MADFKINWHRSINFGDQLNPYIINHFLGFYPEKYEIWNNRTGTHEYLKDPHIIMLGSILNEANKNSTVIGAGFPTKNSRCIEEPNFISVRGKLTLARVNELYGKNDIYIGDPGILMPKIYNSSQDKKYDIGIIPHIIDEDLVYKYFNEYSRKSGKKIKIISLKCNDNKNDLERIIDEINSCHLTISSSLHGLIISHSYNIPSLWVEFSDRVIGNGFKFRDYFSAHIGNYTEYHNYNPYNMKNINSSNMEEVIERASDSFIDLSKSIDVSYKFYSDIFNKIK
jgi:pyruvyltransferase